MPSSTSSVPRWWLGLAAFAASWAPTGAQERARVESNVVRPDVVPATPERIASLEAAPGVRVSVFADGLGKPRMIAVAPDGDVYVTRREPGDLWLLRDADGDGRAEVKRRLLEKKDLHGVAADAATLYLATVREAFAAPRQADGVGAPRAIATGLPDGGQHPNRTLAVGPDGALYLSVGSTCNACRETSPESAALLKMARDGQGRSVFASGLRNTIGFAWHPRTKALWGVDHGIDHLGDDQQKEELNRLEQGRQYGWPYVYGEGHVYAPIEPPAATTKESWAARSTRPALVLTAHSAPMQIVFPRKDGLPASYRSGAVVTLHGSWNRDPPSGYEVVFVRFDEKGEPRGVEPFLSGFLSKGAGGFTTFGRPCGLAEMADGSLLVGDDANGVIYRLEDAARASTRKPSASAASSDRGGTKPARQRLGNPTLRATRAVRGGPIVGTGVRPTS
jgi:glucose/arabinose dehydrogenase